MYAWKRHYGYSSNDPRFLTATFTQVLEDMTELVGERYIQEFESNDRETNEFAKRRELNPEVVDREEREKLANFLKTVITQNKKKEEPKSGRSSRHTR